MLAHTGRVMTEHIRYQQCVSQILSEADRNLFDEILDACKHGFTSSTSAAAPPRKKPRTLKAQISVDGDGFPTMSCLKSSGIFDDCDAVSEELDDGENDEDITREDATHEAAGEAPGEEEAPELAFISSAYPRP